MNAINFNLIFTDLKPRTFMNKGKEKNDKIFEENI